MTTTITSAESYKRIYPLFYDSRPHVETNFDDSRLSNTASDSAKNIFMLGSATNGDPTKVYEIRTSQQATKIFGSGDLVDGIKLAFDPTGNSVTNGGTVYALRVDNAKQASLVKDGLTFTSSIFGTNANQVSVALDNDVFGVPRITVNYSPDNYERTYTNIGQMFSITYSGKSASAGYTVSHDTDGKAILLTLGSGDSIDKLTNVATFDLTMSKYDTIAKLMQAISATPNFSASVVGSPSVNTSYLDEVTSPVDVKTAPAVVTAKIGDAISKLGYDPYVVVTQTSNNKPIVNGVSAGTGSATVSVTTAPASFPANFDTAFLTGGSTGDVPVSWADKFNGAIGNNVYYIIPLTSEENIHAELQAFIDEQHVLGYNYHAFVGGGFAEPLEQILSRQVNINDSRFGLVGQSGHVQEGGESVHVPAYLMAAYVGGLSSSLGVAVPITNKKLALVDLDQNFSGDDLNTLNQNGVIGIEHLVNRNATGGYYIVQDVSTNTVSSSHVDGSLYLGELTDFLFDNLRFVLRDTYIGSNIRSTSADDIKSTVASYLYSEMNNDDGLIVDFSESDIVVTISGTVVYIQFAVAPTQEIKNIVVSGTYSNYSATSEDNTTK